MERADGFNGFCYFRLWIFDQVALVEDAIVELQWAEMLEIISQHLIRHHNHVHARELTLQLASFKMRS